MSGTHPCLELHPRSGTPPSSLELYPCRRTSTHVWNSTYVWSPTPTTLPPPQPPTILPQVPRPHLALAAPVKPLTAPYPPDLAPHCPPSGTLHPATLLLPPPPTLSNIITKGPLHPKKKFEFFRVFRCSFQSHLTWVQSHLA